MYKTETKNNVLIAALDTCKKIFVLTNVQLIPTPELEIHMCARQNAIRCMSKTLIINLSSALTNVPVPIDT